MFLIIIYLADISLTNRHDILLIIVAFIKYIVMKTNKYISDNIYINTTIKYARLN